MKPKHQRLLFIGFSVIFLCVGTLLVLRAFSENLVFFFSPTELAAQQPDPSRLIRLGGLVETGSIRHEDDDRLLFTITDGEASVAVSYQGMVPTLFREGQGAIAEGHMQPGGSFEATRILTKHDEKYMPREVVDALKKTGRWKEDGK